MSIKTSRSFFAFIRRLKPSAMRLLRPFDPSALRPFDPSALRQAQGPQAQAQGRIETTVRGVRKDCRAPCVARNDRVVE